MVRKKMTTQNYLMINESTNVVDNVCDWDGGTEWTPPANTLMLAQATTPAMLWQPVIVENKITDWTLEQQIGQGQIGFTWNGSVLTTNESKPKI
jgi:hypothetical protein